MAEQGDGETLGRPSDSSPIPASSCDGGLPDPDCSQRQHLHWQEDDRILHCDGLLDHADSCTNRENSGHRISAHQSRLGVKPFAVACVTRAYGNLMAPKLVSSDDEKLRETALDALHEAAFCETVRLELVHGESTIAFIMEKIRGVNCGSCIIFGMKILQRCLAGGTDETAMTKLLNSDAVLTSIDLIKHSNSDVQETAIRFLCILGMDNKGKSQAWKRLGIVELLPLLEDNGKSVQTSAAAALMSITVDINAKKAFIDGKGTSSIVPLLNLQDEMLSLNVLQLVTNIAEHPLGRYELQQGISSVQHTMDASKSIVQKRFAKAALRQLRFEHRPFS